MRRIVLGLLTGAGAAWFAWRLRGWPPAYWRDATRHAEEANDVSAPSAPTREPEPSRPRLKTVEPLIELDELELDLLPELSGPRRSVEVSRSTGILGAADRDAAGQGGPRVGRLALVADDDADIRTLAAQLLERAGFEVVTAADGDEALRLAIDREPAVCVLDWMMPRRNGLDVLESLRAGAQTRSTPVLLLTARAASSDVERGLSAGADGYLTKPFTADQLRERVLELVDLRAA